MKVGKWVATYIAPVPDDVGNSIADVVVVDGAFKEDALRGLRSEVRKQQLDPDDFWVVSLVRVLPDSFLPYYDIDVEGKKYIYGRNRVAPDVGAVHRSRSMVRGGKDIYAVTGTLEDEFAGFQVLEADSAAEAGEAVSDWFWDNWGEFSVYSIIGRDNGNVKVWSVIEQPLSKPKLTDTFTLGRAGTKPSSIDEDLKTIQRYRRKLAERPLDPKAAGWGPEDIAEEARRIRSLNPKQLRALKRRLMNG